jgi:hypothetical protein
VATLVVEAKLVSPLILPPVISALAVLKLVATCVVLDEFVADIFARPVMYPPDTTALPVAKFVTVACVAVMLASPLTYPPDITALAVLKLLATVIPSLDPPSTTNEVNAPRLVILVCAAVCTVPYNDPTKPAVLEVTLPVKVNDVNPVKVPVTFNVPVVILVAPTVVALDPTTTAANARDGK